MDLKNIKLVVSDMDGTLLNSKGKVSTKFFSLFKKLKENNITFCAASGRQYYSIVEKLQPIENDIFIVAENGGIAMKKNKILLEEVILPQKINEIIPIIKTIKNANLVLCGKNGAYIDTDDNNFISIFKKYYNNYFLVKDLTKVLNKTTFFKVAVFHPISSEKYLYPELKSLEKHFLVKVSSPNWLDISTKQTNKGNAIKMLQNQLNITKKETLVFGDYHNDIEMMQQSGFSVAMQNGHQDIKDIATFTTKSNDNFGVEIILEKLLKSKKN